MDRFWTPQLLAPAGSLDKLKLAVCYGADAVYLSGCRFGLRAASENFTEDQIVEGTAFAHSRGVEVYVTLNGFLHDADIDDLGSFVDFLDETGVDAVIVSDLGTLETVRERSALPIHLSTQASCLNSDGAGFWREVGASRIILGREAGIEEAGMIKEEAGIEIEMFVHGSLCTAYSGNCVISNFTRGRDSNRGGCAHSCRFEYDLDISRDTVPLASKKAFFMSSKDLRGIGLLPNFIAAGIDSLKIEGRMKSPHYLATVTKVYSEALEGYRRGQEAGGDRLRRWGEELSKVASRGATEASLVSPAGASSMYDGREHGGDYVGLGIVLERHTGDLVVEVRSPFSTGDSVELIPFRGDVRKFQVEGIRTFGSGSVVGANPGMVVGIPFEGEAAPMNILRRRVR